MAGQTAPSMKFSILGKLVVGLWWLTLFVLPMLVDINDRLLFALIVTLLPAAMLGMFLLSVPVWMLVVATIALWRRRWKAASIRLAIPVVGAVMVFSGLFAGDQWLIHVEGAGLEQAVADAAAGRAVAKRFSATPVAAYVETGAFFDMAEGVAYDTTDTLADMLDQEIGERPADWMKKMPPVFSCTGGARHLGEHYYRTNLDPINCID